MKHHLRLHRFPTPAPRDCALSAKWRRCAPAPPRGWARHSARPRPRAAPVETSSSPGASVGRPPSRSYPDRVPKPVPQCPSRCWALRGCMVSRSPRRATQSLVELPVPRATAAPTPRERPAPRDPTAPRPRRAPETAASAMVATRLGRRRRAHENKGPETARSSKGANSSAPPLTSSPPWPSASWPHRRSDPSSRAPYRKTLLWTVRRRTPPLRPLRTPAPAHASPRCLRAAHRDRRP